VGVKSVNSDPVSSGSVASDLAQSQFDHQGSYEAGLPSDPDFVRYSLSQVVRNDQSEQLPTPLQNPSLLPLSLLDPEVLERLAAEIVSRQDNSGCHFYGRRGQAQYGLDIVELERTGSRSLYQVKRYQSLSKAQIRSAIEDYAGQPRTTGHTLEKRRFDPHRFVLVTSAQFDSDTSNVDELEALQRKYEADISIEVWGAETLSRSLRDLPRLVFAVFGPEWARAFCGFEREPGEMTAPDPLGLVEGPITLLRLDTLEADGKALEATDPLGASRLYGIVAEGLDEGNFPGHAVQMRRRQADAAEAGLNFDLAFAIRFKLGLKRVLDGEDFEYGSLRSELSKELPDHDTVKNSKTIVLTRIADWYKHGVDLAVTVPALQSLATTGDPDFALLCCLVLEQAIVDGLYEFNPPFSIVSAVVSNVQQFLGELRDLAALSTHSSGEIRARLRCAVADAKLTETSSPQDVHDVYREVIDDALAGRMLRARGLVASRAAYAFAVRGDIGRANNLWRQSILCSCEDGFYGDAHDAMRALQRIMWDSGNLAMTGFDVAMSALPNQRRILGSAQDPALAAFEAAHKQKLPEAIGDTRRFLWESRLSGHLQEEILAQTLLGDVLREGERPVESVQCYVLAGEGEKAAELACGLPEVVDVLRWARSGLRRRRAAVAQVIKSQSAIVADDDVPAIVHLLLTMTDGLWNSSLVSPQSEHDALKAVASFGIRIPESAVDRILLVVAPALSADTAIGQTVANVLVQTYWAVDSRRQDLADALGLTMRLPSAPYNVWGLVQQLPKTGRAHLLSTVRELAKEGDHQAIVTLAMWREPSAEVQFAARRACASLLRRPIGILGGATIIGTQEAVTVGLLLALLDADEMFEVPPNELTLEESRPAGGAIIATSFVAEEDLPKEGFAQIAQLPSDRSYGSESGVDSKGSTDSDGIDDAATRAAALPLDLTESVAKHLVAMAEDRLSGAASRVQALSALRSLVDRVSPACAQDIAIRLSLVHEDPGLTPADLFELEMNTPLSSFRVDTGAGELAAFSLATSAEAFAYRLALSGQVNDADRLFVDKATAAATMFLRQDDTRIRLLGALTIAALSKAAPEFAWLAGGLLFHGDESVRAIGAAHAVATPEMFEVLAVDPSLRVRAAIAGRGDEIPNAIRSYLARDRNLNVRFIVANSSATDAEKFVGNAEDANDAGPMEGS
jgi:hypothetical protein